MQCNTPIRIEDQHRALDALLSALGAGATLACARALVPEALSCVRLTVELLHEYIEAGVLHPKLAERYPVFAPVLDRVDAQQASLIHKLKESERAAARGPFGEEFATRLSVCCDGVRGHVEVQRNYVIPVAHDQLSVADWRELDAALLDSEQIFVNLRQRQGAVLSRWRALCDRRSI